MYLNGLRIRRFAQFQFDANTLKEKTKNAASKTGLTINITSLSTDSRNSFIDKTFIDTLQKEIELEHMLNINKGLTIKINDYTLKPNKITLINNNSIEKPTYWQKDEKNLSVKILAGISSKDADDGGWYIFCNGQIDYWKK